MITTIVVGDRSCPAVICDWCGRLISETGNVLWRHNNGGEGDRATEIAFTHKGRCDREFEAAHPGRRWLWDEIDTFLHQLAHNFASREAGRELAVRDRRAR